MAGRWETVEDDIAVGRRFDRNPPPSFSAPTPTCTHRQWKAGPPTVAGNNILTQESARRLAYAIVPR